MVGSGALALLCMKLSKRECCVASWRLVFAVRQITDRGRCEADNSADLGIGHAGFVEVDYLLRPSAHGGILRNVVTPVNDLS